MNQCEAKGCNKKITWGTARYSMQAFKKNLCFEHQKEERLKTQPRKMALYINNLVDRNRRFR